MVHSPQNLLHLASTSTLGPLMTHAEYRIARIYGDVYYVVAGVLWEKVGEWSGGSIFAEVGPGGFLFLGFISLNDARRTHCCCDNAGHMHSGGGGERRFLQRRIRNIHVSHSD